MRGSQLVKSRGYWVWKLAKLNRTKQERMGGKEAVFVPRLMD